MGIVTLEISSTIFKGCEEGLTVRRSYFIRKAEPISESTLLALETLEHVSTLQTEERTLHTRRSPSIKREVEVVRESRDRLVFLY